MKSIFGTFRNVHFVNTVQVESNVWLNGQYNPAIVLGNMFKDYAEAGLTKITCDAIPEERYTGTIPKVVNGEIVGTVPKATRLIVGEFEDSVVNEADFKASVQAVGAQFQIEIFPTPEDAIAWVKANTSLEEVEPGKFLTHPASVHPMTNEPVEAKYLTVS